MASIPLPRASTTQYSFDVFDTALCRLAHAPEHIHFSYIRAVGACADEAQEACRPAIGAALSRHSFREDALTGGVLAGRNNQQYLSEASPFGAQRAALLTVMSLHR